jgi:hypothetical protein
LLAVAVAVVDAAYMPSASVLATARNIMASVEVNPLRGQRRQRRDAGVGLMIHL